MSKWRVEIDIAFDTEREVIGFANLIEDMKHKVWKWNDNSPDFPTETKLRYHECFHDETPPKQCGNYISIDFGDVAKVEHKDSTDTKVEGSTLFDEKDSKHEKVK